MPATIGQMPSIGKFTAEAIRQVEPLGFDLAKSAHLRRVESLGQLRGKRITDFGRRSIDATADDAGHCNGNANNCGGQDHPIHRHGTVIIFGEFFQFQQFHLGTFH